MTVALAAAAAACASPPPGRVVDTAAVGHLQLGFIHERELDDVAEVVVVARGVALAADREVGSVVVDGAARVGLVKWTRVLQLRDGALVREVGFRAGEISWDELRAQPSPAAVIAYLEAAGVPLPPMARGLAVPPGKGEPVRSRRARPAARSRTGARSAGRAGSSSASATTGGGRRRGR